MATAVRMATPSTHSNLFVDPGRNVWYNPSVREATAAILNSIYINEDIVRITKTLSCRAIHMSCKIFFGGRIGILFSPNTRWRSRKSPSAPFTISCLSPRASRRQTSSNDTGCNSSSGDKPLLKSTCNPRLSPSSPPIAPRKFRSLGSYSLLPTCALVKANGDESCQRSVDSR